MARARINCLQRIAVPLCARCFKRPVLVEPSFTRTLSLDSFLTFAQRDSSKLARAVSGKAFSSAILTGLNHFRLELSIVGTLKLAFKTKPPLQLACRACGSSSRVLATRESRPPIEFTCWRRKLAHSANKHYGFIWRPRQVC